MRLTRTLNTKRNIFFGLIWRLYITAVPFIIRTIFIYVLGVAYLGLDSLFTSILNVLSLAELGVGNALVFHMYKAIATDDKEKICQLMAFYKKCYRIIGFIVLAIGLCFLPFLKYLIKSDLPADVNLYVLYLIQLAATVVTYWLFAYKNCLLSAHQRNDLVSKVNIVVMTIQYILQIILLLLARKYYFYIVIVPLVNIFKNIATSFVVDKVYPQYRPQGKISEELKKDIFKRMKALLFSKIGAMIVASSDTMVITSFLGLSVAGIYSNYHYIMTAVIGFITIIFDSMTAGVGNSLELETPQKNYNDFKKISFVNDWIIMWCTVCLLCLYQPFINLWVGKDYLFGISTVVLLSCFFYFWKSNNVMLMYKDAGGLWYEDRFRPLIVGLANIILDIVLVRIWGVNGIVFASALVYVAIAIPWLFANVHKYIFKNSPKEMIVRFILNVLITAVLAALTYCLCSLIRFNEDIKLYQWLTLGVRFAICLVVPNSIYFLLHVKSKEMRGLLSKLRRKNG